MPEECHQYKGRIVYRGDRITDQSGQTVFFTEKKITATTPTAIAALNLTLWFWCNDYCVMVQRLCSSIPAMWVQPYLAWEVWLPEWPAKYDRNVKLTVRLVKSFYVHPQSGQRWQKTFGETNFKKVRWNSARIVSIQCDFSTGETEISTLYYSIYL